MRATLELLVEDGYRALTMEQVRERAGVGKATLYRRYGSKEELVRAAVEHLHQELPVPEDTGSLHGDFAAVAQAVLADARRPLRDVDAAAARRGRARRGAAGDLLRARSSRPRRDMLEAMLRRAIERGEIRADVGRRARDRRDRRADDLQAHHHRRRHRADRGDAGARARAVMDGLRPR